MTAKVGLQHREVQEAVLVVYAIFIVTSVVEIAMKVIEGGGEIPASPCIQVPDEACQS